MSLRNTAHAILDCFQPNAVDGLSALRITLQLARRHRLPVRDGNLIDLSLVGRALTALVEDGLLTRIGNLYIADTRPASRRTYGDVSPVFRSPCRVSA